MKSVKRVVRPRRTPVYILAEESKVEFVGENMRPSEKAPRMLEMEDPTMFPMARGDSCCEIAAITTTSCMSSQLELSADAIEVSYLFPFCTSCQKSDQSRWNPQALSDLGSVINELVCAELENKQAPNEGGDVKTDIVVVDHVEKSVIACQSVKRKRSWKSREGSSHLKRRLTYSTVGRGGRGGPAVTLCG